MDYEEAMNEYNERLWEEQQIKWSKENEENEDENINDENENENE